MNKFEKFDEIMSRLIAIALVSFGFGVIVWGVVIAMRWIQKAVLT